MFDQSDKKMIKDAGIVGVLTVTSRILGFVRDAIVAMLLGAGFYSDAFLAALRIPDLFRKFFSDGALSISFIPVFTKLLMREGSEYAFDMARSALILISAGGVLFLLCFIAFTQIFFAEPDLTITLSNIMMPYVISVCILSIFMGILNSMGHFAAPASAPIILNLTIIFFAVFFSPLSESPAVIMAWGVTTGGILQLAIQIPFIVRSGFKFCGKVILQHPDTILAFKMMLPAVIGIAPLQINMLVATFMASSMTSVFFQGSVSYLYYADRLVQFPLGLFAFSVSTSIFPVLSRAVASHDLGRASSIFTRGVRMVLFIMIPSMAGLAVLREPIVALLFNHGAFDINDVNSTAMVLLFFCLGMWAFAGARLFVTLFYALSNVRTPLIGGLISISSNILLSFVLMDKMGVYGLALSISIAAILNFCFLIRSAAIIEFEFPWREISGTACRSFFFSAIMYVVVDRAAEYICPVFSTDKYILLSGVVVCVMLGVSVFGGLGLLFKVPELMFLKKSYTPHQS
ncbi:MAG: murein biosynthesis integral membrane protein MurJ [Desulfamplus sp.]|nr:murein biosynthesis integral membrane protein MurJ [Desulfamplus sp.]